jgi:alpha-L-fucosidase
MMCLCSNVRMLSPLAACVLVLSQLQVAMAVIPSTATPTVLVSTETEPMATGKFEPTWQSLEQYQVPEWFRDAKFGIWAHWGPQCQPERSDWYARGMYEEGSWQYKSHLERYGHPSQFGFKDVINEWHAENWSPDDLLDLYQRAGVKYFVAMANHHDNFDTWDSKHHAWNAVRVGPRKDLMAGWRKAARDRGMRFGVSVHAAHAWMWYEVAQGADKEGPRAGVPYDGKLTAADGIGKWWEGLDPQQLYAQNHAPSSSRNTGALWEWGNGASQPDQAYCEAFYNRTVDLINQTQPDLVYFDDTALPLWPVSDAGLKIAAHYYNSNMQQHGGNLEAVLCGKVLDEQQRKTMVWDIERGQSPIIEPLPWQCDTCIGSWHYDRGIYERGHYKSANTVIRMLVDVVSKNGSMLLSVPVRGDGTIDEKERAIVEGIAAWMDVNKDSIFGTRPWKVCGEGPQLADAAPIQAQGFNEGRGKPFTGEDVRYTTKGDALYAFVMGKPSGQVRFTKLGTAEALLDGEVTSVEQLGAGEVKWTRGDDALLVTPVLSDIKADDQTVVFRITVRR